MNVGPKKFVGKKSNPQIHQHTNKKLQYTDFDTFSLIQRSSKAQSMQTAAHSKATSGTTSGGVHGLKSYMSGSSVARKQRRDNNNNNDDSETKNADIKPVDMLSKNGGNLLSDQLETGSFDSNGVISTGLLNNAVNGGNVTSNQVGGDLKVTSH